MNLKKYLAALCGVAVVAVPAAYAAGLFQTLPIIGGAAYCASSIGTGPAQTGITGQGAGTAGANVTTGNTICGQTVPAGPTTFTGSEVVPVDLNTPGSAVQAGGPATALASILQLGQGPLVINTTAGAATIPAGTEWYDINVANTSVTFTLPPIPAQNQTLLHVALGTTQTTSILFTNNTGETCIPSCPMTISSPITAGSGYTFLWNAPTSQWIRVQ